MVRKRIRGLARLLIFGLLIFSLGGCAVVTPEPTPQASPAPQEVAVAPAFPTLDEMVGISPVIFSGTVVGLRYGRHEESPYPFTFVRFADLNFYRQDAPLPAEEEGTLELSYVGGMDKDNTILEVSHQPEFEMGRRYLVFLRGGGWRLSPIPGGDQGYFLLRGASDEEALVLNSEGEPLAGFEEGYAVYAQPAPSPEPEREEPEQPLQEREIDPEKALELGMAQPEPLDPEEVAKLEAEMDEEILSREQKLDEQVPEPDQPDRYIQLYGEVLTMPEFAVQIKALAEKTRGEYPAFERVYFSPVPTSEEGTFTTPRK